VVRDEFNVVAGSNVVVMFDNKFVFKSLIKLYTVQLALFILRGCICLLLATILLLLL
jgi:hypothetical protein